jgi:hypothetical protein
VYTTWHPGLEAYVSDWARSLRTQTDSAFRLVVGVDGVAPEPWIARLHLHQRVRWIPAPAGASPAQVRQGALQAIIDTASAVVFVDSDDILEPNRVAAARLGLAGADVVACAVRLADAEGRDLGEVFGPPQGLDPVADLPYHNVFGLSNTAYHSATLRACLPIPDDCVLIDWLLATRAWALGARMAFDATPRMVYRQHEASATRVSPPFTGDQILKATDLVLGHYRLVLDNPPVLPSVQASELHSAFRRAERFHQAVSTSPRMLAHYVEALNALSPRYVWWWTVANPELEHLWTS